MGKESEDNFLFKIVTNIYLKNILIMIIVAIVLISASLFALNRYTRHAESVNVPDLRGMQTQDAEAIVASAKLRYEIVDSIYQPEGIPGNILEQIPKADSKVKEGRTIYLTVQSVNELMIAIPDLEDASLRQSQTLLTTLGFTNITVAYIPSEYKDLVYSIEYKGTRLKVGQKIPKGASITIKVGDGRGSGIFIDSLDTFHDSKIEENF